MFEIGKQGYRNYRNVLTPVVLILLIISLVLMFIWTLILPFFNVGPHQPLYNLIGLVLWCVWGLTINVTLQITYLYSRLIEIEPQTHLLFLFVWAEAGNMYCTLFLHRYEDESFYSTSNKNNLLLYDFEKTFFAISNFSFVLMVACRCSQKYLWITSGNIQRILVTTSFVTFVSCFFGFYFYASDAVTVLFLFIIPTLLSFSMVLKESYMRTEYSSEDGLRLRCLAWILLVSSILTLPYQMSLLVAFNNKFIVLIVRASLWKCIINPLLIFFSHRELVNPFLLFVFGSSFLFDDYVEIPSTKEEMPSRKYSPPPLVVTSYGSTGRAIEPIAEEDESGESSYANPSDEEYHVDDNDVDVESYEKVYHDGELKTVY